MADAIHTGAPISRSFLPPASMFEQLSCGQCGILPKFCLLYTSRYCYSKAKAGESLPEEMLDYCRDIDLLYQQIEEIDEEISQHKSERDAAEYTVSSGLSGGAEQPLSFDASFEPAREEAPAQDGAQEETVESATAALDEADGK